MKSQTTLKNEKIDFSPNYQSILLATDSSDHSNRAITEAVAIAHFYNAKITGAHVYAAKLHDMRFRQMEGGLPEQFRQEQELERQRDVHDDLITRGLSIITDSYLDQVEQACKRETIRFSRCALEGKNYRALIKEANKNSYALLIMGAKGVGAIAGSHDLLGTVCERLVRRTDIDTLVIKEPQRSLAEGTIVVAVDGSSRSYGGLLTALSLASHWHVPVKVVAAFDPYFHYVAFNRIAGVLSEEAGKVFKFKQQEKLHEEVIDSGLAKIYQGHLSVAESVAAECDMTLETVLLDGKPYDAIEKYCRKLEPKPSLLVIGKIGIHADPELDIGGNAENLLRNVDCAVLLSQRQYQPQLDVVADVTTAWTEEAEKRMERVPSFVRNMARMAILRYAQQQGHTVITERIVEEATAKLMPSHAEKAMSEIVAAHDAGKFKEKEKGKWREGTNELHWQAAALARLMRVPEGFMRDRSRERIETDAREQGLSEITLEVVEQGLALARQAMKGGHPAMAANKKNDEKTENDDPIIWRSDAEERMQKVPKGFMREMTRQRVEAFARRMGVKTITSEWVDKKYAEWAAGSEKQSATLNWDEGAWERIKQIPSFVRGMVILEIERCAKEMGENTVTHAVVDKANAIWGEKGGFHSQEESHY
jgi:nucleotide-binding universal stress UspA family protein